MKRVALLVFLFSVLALVGCKKSFLHHEKEDVAGVAAKQYYEYLRNDSCEAFVDGTYREKTLRPAFKAELVESAKMLRGRYDEKHGGIAGITVKSTVVDTAMHVANAYLDLKYGDGSTETILVPMVEKDGLWYMR